MGQSVTACFICSDISGLVLSHDAQWKKKKMSHFYRLKYGCRLAGAGITTFLQCGESAYFICQQLCGTVCLLLQLFGSVTADVTLTAAAPVINHQLASVQSSLMQPLARE